MKSYTFDFEMTTYNGVDDKTEVWLAYFEDIDSDENKLMTTIDEVMNWLLKQNEVNFYAHNLGGFDGLAIVDWLDKHNYLAVSQTRDVSDLNFFYMGRSSLFTIYTRQENGDLYSISFIDSLNYLTGSLEDFGKMLGLEKGETPLIPHGQEHNVSTSDISYIKRDVAILKRVLNRLKIPSIYENRMRSLSSFAYQTAISEEEELNLERMADYEPALICKGWKSSVPKKQKRFTKKVLGEIKRARQPHFPFTCRPKTLGILQECDQFMTEEKEKLAQASSDQERSFHQKNIEDLQNYRDVQFSNGQKKVVHEALRGSYRGGVVYLNQAIKQKNLGELGAVIDVNSRHPYTYSTQRLPKDFIKAFDSFEEMDRELEDYLYFVSFDRLKATVKKGRTPILKARTDDHKNYKITQKAVPEVFDFQDIIITQIDYEYLLENYRLEVTEGICFHAFSVHYELMALLKKHSDYWYEKKRQAGIEGDRFAYYQAKSMLNNVTGYLAINPDKHRSFGGVRSSQSNIAASSFINAYARRDLANTMNSIGLDSIYYANADSIHFQIPKPLIANNTEQTKTNLKQWLEEKGLVIDDFALGAWKIETLFTQAKYLTFMVYGYQVVDGQWKTKIAGLNKQVNQFDFYVGNRITHLVPCRVDGGILLKEADFILAGGI